ncbi:MAG TPA: 30S ribosomal protein S7 [Planctomycetota bacterium]
MSSRKPPSDLSAKLVRCLMKDGARSRVERAVSAALENASRRLGGIPLTQVLRTAVSNARPLIELKKRNVAGALYQVPVPVDQARSYSLAIGSLVRRARRIRGGSLEKRLAMALLEAWRGETDRPDTPKRAARLRVLPAYEGRA